MESDWRAGGELLNSYIMGIIGEILEGYWRGIGEIFEGYWRGNGEIFEGYWRVSDLLVGRYWSQHQFYCTFFPSLLPGFGYTS